MARPRKTIYQNSTQLSIDAVRAAIYLRVSTEDQAESGLGIDAQRSRCLSLIESRGWTFAGEYPDEGISGTKDVLKRPALNRMLNEVKAGRVNTVVILSLDRLGRRAEMVLRLTREITEYGAQLVSCKEQFDTSTPQGEMMLGLFASFAQLERGLTVQRTKSALDELGNRTGYKGGRMPYGYRYMKDGSTVEILPEQANYVRKIFVLRAYGKPMQQIADELNELRILPPRGQEWHGSTVYRILENAEKYKGTQRYASGRFWPIILDQEAVSFSA